MVESFHLPDRLRARVPHQQRFAHERVPAVLELCVQAGVDVPGLRAVRRAEPVDAGGSAQGGEGALRRLESAQRGVYSRKDADLVRDSLQLAQLDAIGEQVTWEVAAAAKQREVAARLSASLSSAQLHLLHGADEGLGGGDAEARGEDVRAVATAVLTSWLGVRAGVERLMEKYAVQTCGYCPEVHVGPAGHKVRHAGACRHPGSPQWLGSP